jgi:hypothetical protein
MLGLMRVARGDRLQIPMSTGEPRRILRLALAAETGMPSAAQDCLRMN